MKRTDDILSDLQLVSAQQVAELFGVTEEDLEQWRIIRDGPEFVQVGDRPLYPIQGLALFCRRNLTETVLAVTQPPKRKKRAA